MMTAVKRAERARAAKDIRAQRRRRSLIVTPADAASLTATAMLAVAAA